MFKRLKQTLSDFRNIPREHRGLPVWAHVFIIYGSFLVLLLLDTFKSILLGFVKMPWEEFALHPIQYFFVITIFAVGGLIPLCAVVGLGASLQALIERLLKSKNKAKIALEN